MASERVLDAGIALLHARAVLAIARADHSLGLEEGLRLAERFEARAGGPISLENLLLELPIDPTELASDIRLAPGPFRGGVHPGELAKLIIADAIAVILAKGYVSEAEAKELFRFAGALGCTAAEVRAMSHHVAPWLSAL